MKILGLICIAFFALGSATECSKELNHVQQGVLTSPNYPKPYPNDAFCNYRIEMKDGEHVHFMMDSMQATADKGHDLLMLFDGPDCMSERLGVYSQSSRWPMISSTNIMTALFFSDMSGTDKGFTGNFRSAHRVSKESLKHSAKYFSKDVPDAMLNCGSELPARNNTFTVPPSTRLPNVCIWRVRGSPHQKISVTISEAQNLNAANWLRVLDGGSCDKKTLLYLHNVVGSKVYNTTSTQNEVIIFMVRVPGFAPQKEIKISYTLSELPQAGLKAVSDLSFYFAPDYQIPENAGVQTSTAKLGFALVATWVIVTFGTALL